MKAYKNSYRYAVSIAEKKIISDCPVKRFEDIPGPRPLPFLGNFWRYLPIIGKLDSRLLST